MRALVLAALILAGCPRPVPPPTPDLTTATQIPSCAPTAPTPDAVCEGLFIAEGLACARCPGVGNCVDRIDRIYCVAGGCLDDARCHLETIDAADGGVAGRRKPR